MTIDQDEKNIALIGKDIQYIQRDISEIKVSMKELAGTYVTNKAFLDFVNNDFANVKKLVYGAVGLLLMAFGLAAVNFFLSAQ